MEFFAKQKIRLVEQALDYLDCVDMRSLAKDPISSLSGGQQQRLFFARALAQKAELYLMDEPFAGVDAQTEVLLIKTLHQLCALRKTVVVIHHNVHNAAQIFDHALMLNKKQLAFGTTQEVWSESNLQKTFAAHSEVPL